MSVFFLQIGSRRKQSNDPKASKLYRLLRLVLLIIVRCSGPLRSGAVSHDPTTTKCPNASYYLLCHNILLTNSTPGVTSPPDPLQPRVPRGGYPLIPVCGEEVGRPSLRSHRSYISRTAPVEETTRVGTADVEQLLPWSSSGLNLQIRCSGLGCEVEEAGAKEEEQQGDGELQCANEGVDWSAPHRGEEKRWRRGVTCAGCREKIGNLGEEKMTRTTLYCLPADVCCLCQVLCCY